MSETILKIENLVTEFSVQSRLVPAVRGVPLEVKKGKTLVVPGESGSGKSVMLRSILRVLPRGTRTNGSIVYNGQELLDKSEAEMRQIRGNRIAMVFQDSLSAMDPLYRVGAQVGENIREHQRTTREFIRKSVIQLFEKVDIPSPKVRAKAFLHIAFMYAGRIVEYDEAKQVLGMPFHPYTRGLIFEEKFNLAEVIS